MTTNFNDWLDCLQEATTETMAHLYQSITEVTQMGDFTTIRRGSVLIVTAEDHEDPLMLTTEHAKNTFLKILNWRFGGEFGSVLGAAEFQRAMEKND